MIVVDVDVSCGTLLEIKNALFSREISPPLYLPLFS